MERGTVYAIAGGVLAVGGLAGVALYLGRRNGVSTPAEGSEVYALARAIASEQGNLSGTAGLAIGFAIRNHARYLGRSILRTVAPNGWESQQGGGYVATAVEPASRHIGLASQVLAPGAMDITGGAEYFDSPRAQRALLARGTPGYRKTPEQVAAARVASGLELVVLPGIDPDHLRFWRRAGAEAVS
jgi:hypothetical protein